MSLCKNAFSWYSCSTFAIYILLGHSFLFLGQEQPMHATYYAPELKQQTLTLDIFGLLVIKNCEKSFTTMFMMNWLFHYCVRTILSITMKMVNQAIHFGPKLSLHLSELGMCIFFLKLSFHQRLWTTMNDSVQWGKVSLLLLFPLVVQRIIILLNKLL